jgi:NADH-quinone oxidoreductase subunit M
MERASWIPAYGIQFLIGLDGISLFLILLTTFLGPIVILSSWTAIKDRVTGYHFHMLLLQTAMLGAFVSIDLFLFYVFWEAMLIPMYFLIGMWGGAGRIYATIKFFIFTMVGSLLMLVAILFTVFYYHDQSGVYTFELLKLYQLKIPFGIEPWLFAAFALSFAIKVPMFPLHTWLPDAHTEAPTGGSVILAGILLKMGTYGFLRFAIPLFPHAAIEAVPYIVALAIIGIIYGACVSMVQPDVKRLVAFSSVSHLGYVMLGLFVLNTQGVSGGIYQMLNHGLSTGALFLLVGVLYERRHTRLISDYGGIAAIMPLFTAVFMIVTLSSIGLPLTNGFIGEFLILLGTFKVNKAWAAIAAVGVILGAVYMLWMFQRMMFGKVTNPKNENLKDLNLREALVFLPIIVMIIFMGVCPNPFLRYMDTSVNNLIRYVKIEGGATGANYIENEGMTESFTSEGEPQQEELAPSY